MSSFTFGLSGVRAECESKDHTAEVTFDDGSARRTKIGREYAELAIDVGRVLEAEERGALIGHS